MMIQVLKSKLHCVRVTEANLNYMGSITIDEDLMDAANLIAGEKVQIVNNNNGERLETYIIKGERGSGCICLNGAAARKVQVGDICIIISYAMMDFEEAKTFTPGALRICDRGGRAFVECRHRSYIIVPADCVRKETVGRFLVCFRVFRIVVRPSFL